MSIDTPDDVRFRSATNQDRERITALLTNVLAEFGLRPDHESTDADLCDIEENYLAAGGIFEVMEDAEGNLLGTVGLYPLDRETCELRKMYFASEVRGRGLGRHVMNRVVSHARRLGFRRITLETASVLEGAIRLYTGFGFVAIESDHLSPRCDQAYALDLQP